MSKIAFKVSARAARLIGRENVATSQGAVTELVKNSYDADATTCVILFRPRFDSVQQELSVKDYHTLSKFLPTADTYYVNTGDHYVLVPSLLPDVSETLTQALGNIVDLWIIDNGNGMSSDIIEKSWMVIGTDTKEINSKSTGGRTVTGAKGIGRFALDRLGAECELFSAVADSPNIVHWIVDWGDFEGEGKVIGDVTAVLEAEPDKLTDVYRSEGLMQLMPTLPPEKSIRKEVPIFTKGTAIKISKLNDIWDVRDSAKLKETLEALLPPKDRGDFNIYVHDHRLGEENGWIDNFPPDQYDYLMDAQIDGNGEVSITLKRQEIDPTQIRARTFTLQEMNREGFRKEDFAKGEIQYTRSLKSIMKRGPTESDEDLLEIGPLHFTLYFFKLSNPNKDALEKYPQKMFDVQRRKRWLSNSGGIRLYRDDFRVRPYGEPNTQGSDWLLLGQRNAANPAAVSRPGQWTVTPQQVAGTIQISKDLNPLLADQSNREGIMNERAFALFRDIILALISEFERDRNAIFAAFEKAYSLDHPDEGKVAKGRKAAKRVLQNKSDEGPTTENDTPTTDDLFSEGPEPPQEPSDPAAALQMAEALDITVEQNRELREEIQVLRGMATLGTVLVSFTHELRQIKANMGARQQRMKGALDDVVDPGLLATVPEQVNPYNILTRWGREDEKVSRWVDFALSSVSPKKRRRQYIDLNEYLSELRESWQNYLETKQTSLIINPIANHPLELLAHEIDLDSIFYNLIVNSVEAFTKPGSPPLRTIDIALSALPNNMVKATYSDSGPGISDYFQYPEEIFLFGRSSKPSLGTNETAGTGIGMWLLKSIVDDYGGLATIKSKIGQPEFSLEIVLPIKPAEGESDE